MSEDRGDGENEVGGGDHGHVLLETLPPTTSRLKMLE